MLSRSRSLIIVSSTASDGEEKEKERQREGEREIRQKGREKDRKKRERQGESGPRRVHGACTVIRMILRWRIFHGGALRTVRCTELARARVYKCYVRCIQEELARDAPRCATAEKARAAWERAAIHRVCVRTKKVGRNPCAYIRVYMRLDECVCCGSCKRHTHVRTYISAEAGGRVHIRRRSNVRTSPLDFVDGISTWIDYFAIDVCRKYGEYACREP